MYSHMGSMVYVGGWKAIADLAGKTPKGLRGRLAWIGKRLIGLRKLMITLIHCLGL